MSRQPVLVTGATGLVGNNVVRQLLARGADVRVLVREGSDPRPLEGLDVEVHHGDICRPGSLQEPVRDARTVVHAAGHVHIGRTQLELHRAVNVDGARNVAVAAREARARMVHVSSCDAIGVGSLEAPADEETPPGDPCGCTYAITKREAEEVIHAQISQGLDAVIVNPGFMLGPWDWKPSSGRMLLEVAQGNAWFAPRGQFSVCDVRDVASAIIAASQFGQCGRRYILAGETMSYLQAFRLFAEVTGGRRPLGRPGPVLLMLAGWMGDLHAKLTGNEPVVNSTAIRYAWLPKSYSSRRAREELGYTTRQTEETVRDAWDWFRHHGYA